MIFRKEKLRTSPQWFFCWYLISERGRCGPWPGQLWQLCTPVWGSQAACRVAECVRGANCNDFSQPSIHGARTQQPALRAHLIPTSDTRPPSSQRDLHRPDRASSDRGIVEAEPPQGSQNLTLCTCWNTNPALTFPSPSSPNRPDHHYCCNTERVKGLTQEKSMCGYVILRYRPAQRNNLMHYELL